jgi:phospholipase/carboxylesterase
VSVSDLDHRVRSSRGEPAGALVLFHGRGADELDLLPLLDALDPAGRLLGITPRGPLSLPPGGAHWYVVPRVGFPELRTFHDSYARIERFLAGVAESHGVPIERTVLGGFSQGTVMAYALGLGGGRPRPAGILALSGFIPTVDGFQVDFGPRRGLPVAIAHGALDPVIDVGFARDTRARLQAGGLDVLYRESPLGHTIDPNIVPELRGWLDDAIDRAAQAPMGAREEA